MSSEHNYNSQFVLADANHDGTIDEKEFRQFLGPVIRDEKRLSGNISQHDIQRLSVSYFKIFIFINIHFIFQ